MSGMASVPPDFTKRYPSISGLPAALTDQPLYMNMDSFEDFVPMGDRVMSHNSTAGYDIPISAPEDYEYAMSDVSSALSEPPHEMDLDYELESNADFVPTLGFDQPMSSSPSPYEESPMNTPWQRPVSSFPDIDEVSLSSEFDCDGAEDEFAYEDVLSDEDEYTSLYEADESGPLEKFYRLKIDLAVTKFEKLPYEVVSRIACLLPSDSDLACLIMTCHTFARQLQPENSSVWKTRFLQKYDHPLVEGPYEFRIAYQLRAMALPRFGDLGFETRSNARILLTILKDMVLETYNKLHSWHTNPGTSLNMLAFSDAMKSDWMVHFLSTRLFARDHKHPYGRHPYNKLFDTLQVVFSYLVLNRSTMAFQVGGDKSDYDLKKVYNWDQPFALLYERLPDKEPKNTSLPQSSLFPNLRRETPPPKMHFKLDMNTLLHIRNFWHRHLTEAKAMGGEETFVNTATDLAEVGIFPRAWTQPLQQPSKLQMKWYGHYSCIYPWPKSRRQLEEKESEAEVWETVDPLCLDFSSHHCSTTAWPHIFSSIPALAKTITSVNASPEKGTHFIRGLAPFQSPTHIKIPVPQHTLSLQHHHPFTRLRLRGLLHPIKDQSGIPGWKRAVFVLYKPTFRYLSDVFDNATDWFGEPFEQTLNLLNAALAADMSHAEMEARYQARLMELLGDLKGPVEMSREVIEAVEDAFADPGELDWGDIEHAYAYEGVVTPGGKVMLGRWWRVGPPGPYAVGEGAEFLSPDRVGDCERGPFVFWACD